MTRLCGFVIDSGGIRVDYADQSITLSKADLAPVRGGASFASVLATKGGAFDAGELEIDFDEEGNAIMLTYFPNGKPE